MQELNDIKPIEKPPEKNADKETNHLVAMLGIFLVGGGVWLFIIRPGLEYLREKGIPIRVLPKRSEHLLHGWEFSLMIISLAGFILGSLLIWSGDYQQGKPEEKSFHCHK